MQNILDTKQKQQERNQQFFNEIQYSQAMNHNIGDAIYQLLLDVLNQQVYYTLNIIVIVLSDGQDFSNNTYHQLIQMIRNLKVTIIIGDYTNSAGNDTISQLRYVQNALPLQVLIVKDLTFQQIHEYCNNYFRDKELYDQKMKFQFAMSNLISIKSRIIQMSHLFGQIISNYEVEKLYFINNVLQSTSYYVNFTTQDERDEFKQYERNRENCRCLIRILFSILFLSIPLWIFYII